MLPVINSKYGLIDEDLLAIVNDMANNSSKVKAFIFKNVIMNAEIDKKDMQKYLGSINSLLMAFEKYGDEVAKYMRNTTPNNVGHGISYDGIKDYLYGKYDYVSPIPFVDGLIRLIKDGKIKENKDVIDFFEHTADKAFNHRAVNTAGLVDEVISNEKDYDTIHNDYEVKKFNAVKDQKIFNSRDRIELYKAVDKVIEFLVDDLNNNRYERTRDMKLLVSYVNNVIEYVTYSVTAYITRIFIIGKYASSFIAYSAVKTIPVPVNESVDPSNVDRITIMNELDELDVRDMIKLVDYIEDICDFIKVIGGTLPKDLDLKRMKAGEFYYIPDLDANNRLLEALLGNSFYEFLTNQVYNMFIDYGNDSLYSLINLNNNISEFLSPSNQALSTETTAKQGMMRIIRDVNAKNDTKESYVELAHDLFEFTLFTLSKIMSIYVRVRDYRMREANDPIHNNSALTVSAELMKQFSSIYKEIAIATLSKFRDIEMNINDLNNKEESIANDSLKIKVPGEKNDVSSNNNMMTAVPDTERIPAELLNLYAKPAFEYYQLYDEYASSLLPADEYYVEASIIINKIKAWLEAILAAIKRRWNDVKFQNAVKWVQKNKGVLQSSVYSGEMEVLPYTSIKIDYIDQVIEKLNGINADLFKDNEQFNTFINSLYVTPELQFIFNGNLKDDVKLTKFQNYILFGIDPKMNQDVKPKKIVDNQIRETMMKVWVPSVISSPELTKELVNDGQKINKAIANINSAASNVTNASNDLPPDMGSQPETNNTPNKPEEKVDVNAMTAKLQSTLNDLWKNLEPSVYKLINDQYGYIQHAFSLRQK